MEEVRVHSPEEGRAEGHREGDMTYVLVHGAWHSKSCWDETISYLERQGKSAIALDLPGHGANGKPGWGVSLDAYAKAVIDVAAKQGGPVHVVGHSMGGIVISAAAEARPDLFASLTYLNAFLLEDGGALLKRAQSFEGSKLEAAIKRPNLLRGFIRLKEDMAPGALYNCCTDAARAKAVASLQPQSLRPMTAKVKTTAARWGSVPRHYIFSKQDLAVPYTGQVEMEAKLPCAGKVTLDADHSPFLSCPEQLADAISAVTTG